MRTKSLFINSLTVALALGTAWAVRGKFGHEQGAAWAGAIGALCILAIAKRPDWNAKVFSITLLAAIGWGLGGIMSYGIVVGYGKGTDFLNVYYGFTMLGVIGGLYGFIGGGLFGLGLSDSKTKPVHWLLLLSGMTTSGFLAYYFLIMEWDWLMTPPRSEAWAGCLGAALFLTAYLYHHGFQSALKVAAFSGLGAGFGFAFGNFLQVLGLASGYAFNFWNVMEYSLGFFGGLGMAYSTYTASWPENQPNYDQKGQTIPLLLVFFFIPFVVWNQSFTAEKLEKVYEALPGFPPAIQIISLCLILLGGGWIYFLSKNRDGAGIHNHQIQLYFGIHLTSYIIFSYLLTNSYFRWDMPEQHLYWVNLAVIFLLIPKGRPVFEIKENNQWIGYLAALLVILAILAFVIINTHGELPGTQKRF